MVIKTRENSIAAWAFLIGVILTVITGIFTRTYDNPIILLFMIGLGLIVGYFVSEKEVQTFLFASAATVLASFAGMQGFATNIALSGISISGIGVGKIMASTLSALLFFFVPATIIVALKTIFSIAKV